METPQEERSIYEWFLASVLLKGAISVAEVIVGVLVIFLPIVFVQRLIEFLADIFSWSPWIAATIVSEAGHYTEQTSQFLTFYLLSRGLIKVFLIWALVRNKLWAYPLSLGIMTLFLLYQFWQIYVGQSLMVIGITIFDIIVMYFIWREWRIVERHQRGI